MDTKIMKEYGAIVGLGLRRPPRREVEELLVVVDPEEPLKSERVEEALRAMPDWEAMLEDRVLVRVKELPTPEVATLYTAYVTGLAASLRLPVALSVLEDLVMVTLYARGGGGVDGVTESVLELARQIG